MPPTPSQAQQRGKASIMAELVIETGPQKGAHIQLEPGRYRAGSAVCNDIVLLDPSVADTHFLLDVSDAAVSIEADEASLAIVGKRRGLPVGAAPLLCGKPLRFAAGDTHFLLDPAGAALPARKRRVWLALASPIVACGMLLVASGTAPASITGAAPQLASAPGREANARAAAPSTAEILDQIHAKLHAAQLDSVQLAQAADGSVALTGIVPPAQEPPLRAVQRWFDAAFGARLMLIDGVKVANEPPPLAVRAAWTGSEPYVIDGAGQRLLLGARLASGWVIATIAPDCVILQRDGRTLAVHF